MMLTPITPAEILPEKPAIPRGPDDIPIWRSLAWDNHGRAIHTAGVFLPYKRGVRKHTVRFRHAWDIWAWRERLWARYKDWFIREAEIERAEWHNEAVRTLCRPYKVVPDEQVQWDINLTITAGQRFTGKPTDVCVVISAQRPERYVRPDRDNDVFDPSRDYGIEKVFITPAVMLQMAHGASFDCRLSRNETKRSIKAWLPPVVAGLVEKMNREFLERVLKAKGG